MIEIGVLVLTNVAFYLAGMAHGRMQATDPAPSGGRVFGTRTVTVVEYRKGVRRWVQEAGSPRVLRGLGW